MPKRSVTSFQTYYRDLFDTFGYPLGRRSATPPSVISAAEKRLGVRIPTALRDFYLVAGRERRFNQIQNWLSSPNEWFVDKSRLAFLRENQAVCWWAVRISEKNLDDPPVLVGVGEQDDAFDWQREHAKCSVFIAVMLHYHGVCGGFPNIGEAALTEKVVKKLKRGWRYVGQIRTQRAYCRQNQAAFLTQDFRGFRIMAGAKTKRDFHAIESDLGVEWLFQT